MPKLWNETLSLSCFKLLGSAIGSKSNFLIRLSRRWAANKLHINIRVEEYWEPQLEGLEQIVASRQIPCIHILLSLDKLDETVLGLDIFLCVTKQYLKFFFFHNLRHQNSKEKTTFWVEHPQKSSAANNSNKRKGQHHRSTGSSFRNKGGTSTSKYVSKN